MQTKLFYGTLTIILIASMLLASLPTAVAAADDTTTPGYWTDPAGDVPAPEADLLSGSITVTPDNYVDIRAQFASQPFPKVVSIGWCLDLDQNSGAGQTECYNSDLNLSLTYSVPYNKYTFTVFNPITYARKDLDACQYSWYDPVSKTYRIKFPLSLLGDDGIFNYFATVSYNGSGGTTENAPNTPGFSTPGGYFTSARVDDEIPFPGSRLCSWPTLAASPTLLNFKMTTGGATPPAQPVSIINTDYSASVIDWSARESLSWLSLSKISGTTPGSTYFSMNPVGLGPGVYAGPTEITSTAAKDGSPQTVFSVLEVLTASGGSPTDCPAKLAGRLRLTMENRWYQYFGSTIFSPTDQMLLSFSILPSSLGSVQIYLNEPTPARSGYAIAFNDGLVDGKYPYNPDQWNNVEVLYDFSTHQYITTINGTLAGAQPFRYADSNSVWSMDVIANGATAWMDSLSIYRIAGGTRQPLFGATFDDGYTADSYPTAAAAPNVLLSAPCAANPTTWSVTPQSLRFDVEPGQTTAPAQQVQIAKTGPAAATWTLSENSLWLQPSSTSGTMPATIDVAVDATGLEPGLYAVDLVFTPANVQGRQQTVPVTLVVKEPYAPPGAFDKSGPGGTNQPINGPQISWTASSGATSYQYCFDPDANTTCDTGWRPAVSPTSLGSLSYSTGYSYQVRALSGAQSYNITEASGGWGHFTTRDAPPPQAIPGYWTDPAGDVPAPEADLLSGSITVTPDNYVDVRAQFASQPFPKVGSISWCLGLDQNLGASRTQCGSSDISLILSYNTPFDRYTLSLIDQVHVRKDLDACQYTWYDPASKTLRIKFPLTWLGDDGLFNYSTSVTMNGNSTVVETAPDSPDPTTPSVYFTSARVADALAFPGSWLCSWPTQSVSPTRLNFTTKAGMTPPSQLVSIINPDHGASALEWSAKETTSWLSLSQTSGTMPASPYFSINPSGLDAGVYFGETVITSAAAKDGSPRSVYSVLEVLSPTGEPPTDCPARLATMGGLQQYFETTQFNATDKMLVSFSVIPASSGYTLIYMSESGGRSGYYTRFQDGLVDGKYQYRYNPGQWNNVEMWYDFDTHQYTTMINGMLAGIQPFHYADTNSINGIFIATESGTAWFDSLSIYRITGYTRQPLFGATFDDGYNRQNTFQPPQAALSAPCAAQATTWSVTPQSLSFTVEQGQSAPLAQQLQITKDGPAAATWTLSKNAAWLQTDSTAGSMPAVVNVSINPTGLVPGTYSGSVLLTPAGVKGQPQTVPVTLVVKEPYAPPGAFDKSGPGGANQPITGLQISWTASSGATSYQYCLDPDANTTCDTGWRPAVSPIGLGTLTYNTQYSYQVRAANGPADDNRTAASGGWAAFTTQIAPPAAFTKTGPNGTNNPITGLQISWTDSTGATGYEHCLDADTNTTCDSGWIAASPPVALGPLTYGTTYSYQVRAANGPQPYNMTEAGDWGAFTTQVEPPAPFNKQSPGDGDNNQSITPTLTWNPSARATAYAYCYYTAPDTGCDAAFWAKHTTTAMHATLPALAYSTTYFWQVRAVNGSGTVMADNGAFWRFITGEDPDDDLPIHFYLPYIAITR